MMGENQRKRGLPIVTLLVVVLLAAGCGDEEPVGGFMVYTPGSSQCTIRFDPDGARVSAYGQIDNMAGDKAVKVSVQASFYAEPHGSQLGASAMCSYTRNVGDFIPTAGQPISFYCELDVATCPRSYVVTFPNNHHAVWAGPF